MSSNFNAAEIWNFINDHHQQTSPSHEGWGSDSYSPYTTPRRPSPLVHDVDAGIGAADLANAVDMMSISDGDYTTSSYTTSLASRRSVVSSVQPSLFSQSSHHSRRKVGRYAPSTVPSTVPTRNAPGQTFAQQFGHIAEHNPESHNFMLWCEFCDLKNCNATFRGDDEGAWIEHHCRHLRDHYPRQVVCWFCDDIPFVSERSADRYANFVLRMQHIRGHIFDEHQTRNNMRPDFHIINHLQKHNLIDQEAYNHAMGYDELPASLRLPGESDQPLGPPQLPRDRGQFVVLEKEKRPRRRDRERDSTRRKW